MTNLSDTAGGLQILLVEDHADTALVMSRVLSSFGHQVTTAETVAQALETASRNHKFDLLISDLGLPDGSGLDLMRQIREQYDFPGIALTGFGPDDDPEGTLAAGFVEHLTKPVDMMALRDAIERVVR